MLAFLSSQRRCSSPDLLQDISYVNKTLSCRVLSKIVNVKIKIEKLAGQFGTDSVLSSKVAPEEGIELVLKQASGEGVKTSFNFYFNIRDFGMEAVGEVLLFK